MDVCICPNMVSGVKHRGSCGTKQRTLKPGSVIGDVGPNQIARAFERDIEGDVGEEERHLKTSARGHLVTTFRHNLENVLERKLAFNLEGRIPVQQLCLYCGSITLACTIAAAKELPCDGCARRVSRR